MTKFDEALMLECLEQTPPDVSPVLPQLAELYKVDPETATAHAKLMRLQLNEKKATDQILQLLGLQAEWFGIDRSWRQELKQDLEELFSDAPNTLLYLQLSGLDSPRVRVREAMRRVNLLNGLSAGDHIYMKNFGFGTLQEVRPEDRRLVVDFAKRPGHELEMGFAAETMEKVSPDHLFAIRHLEPERMEQLVKEKPDEVVRITLRSFGPTAAPQVQKLLVPEIVEEKKWKTFWANARKELKKDPLVVLPSKRSEPIELMQSEKSYDGGWFEGLKSNLSMEDILAQVEEYLEANPEAKPEGEEVGILVDRLKFVRIGAEGKHYDYLVRIWLITRKVGIQPEDVGLEPFLNEVKEPAGLLKVVEALNANLTKAFFAALADTDAEAACEALLKVLPELEYSALSEAISLLFGQEQEEKVASSLRQVWNQWTAEVDVMFWLSQNSQKIREWNYGNTPDLVARLLKVLNRDYAGNRLRVQNQLRDLFRQPAWLKTVLDAMDDRQRRAFTQGVKDSTAWEQLEKNSVLGQIVKIDRSLGDIVSGKSDDADTPAPKPRVTSERSYVARQAALKKLIEKDIPENTEEIARAREYGDLRENFEYKAAKDTQRLLHARRGEYESDLRVIKPSDFTEFPTDKAGIGTTVGVRLPDGSEATYHILGEWDSDVSLNILPSESGLAQALEGFGPGDTPSIPSEHGEVKAEILSVTPLADEARSWLAQGLS